MLSKTSEFIEENSRLILLVCGLIAFFFISKPVFFVLLFVILDYLKNVLELRLYMNYLPVKIMEIGIITLSYYYSFWIGFLLIGFYFFDKFIFGRLDDRSFYDPIALTIICILADLSSPFNFIVVGLFLFIMRYILDFTLEFFMTGKPRMSNLPARLINSFVAYFIFGFFSLIL